MMQRLEQWIVVTTAFVAFDAAAASGSGIDGTTLLRDALIAAAVVLVSDGVWLVWRFFSRRKGAL